MGKAKLAKLVQMLISKGAWYQYLCDSRKFVKTRFYCIRMVYDERKKKTINLSK